MWPPGAVRADGDLMKRVALLAAVLLLALPSGALAAARAGVVLSVDRAHHTLQLVDGRHVVHAYRYRGRLPTVHAGSRISFQPAGRTITHVSARSAQTRTVSYYARVLRSSRQALVLRLGDGSNLKFSDRQVKRVPSGRAGGRHHPPLAHIAARGPRSVSVAIQGLEAGITVLIAETVDSSGNVTITIALPPGATSGVGPSQQAGGVVADVSQDGFVLDTPDGSELRLHAAQSTLAGLGLQACETVTVTYHQDANILVADSVQSTGSSTTGDCADSQPTDHATGTITQVSATGLTLSTDQGPQTFTVDSADITAGFQVGDLVEVTSAHGVAGDVEYVEQDATGTVTAVAAGSVTISGDGGPARTFVADPSQGMFDGIAAGDQVDVIYHQSSGQMVADVVDAGS